MKAVVLFIAENRIISFTSHSKLGSADKYSTYFQPNFAMKVGNYLYPSFYVSFSFNLKSTETDLIIFLCQTLNIFDKKKNISAWHMLCMYMRCYVMLYRKIIINRITVIMNKSMNQFPYSFFFTLKT